MGHHFKNQTQRGIASNVKEKHRGTTPKSKKLLTSCCGKGLLKSTQVGESVYDLSEKNSKNYSTEYEDSTIYEEIRAPSTEKKGVSLPNKPNSSDSHYLYELYDEASVQPKSQALRPGNSILSVKLPVNLDDEKLVSIPDIKKTSSEDISTIRKDLILDDNDVTEKISVDTSKIPFIDEEVRIK